MTLKKFAASLVLSAALVSFGAVDCVVGTSQVAFASSMESRLVESLINVEQSSLNINEMVDIRESRQPPGMGNTYGYQNYNYIYVR